MFFFLNRRTTTNLALGHEDNDRIHFPELESTSPAAAMPVS